MCRDEDKVILKHCLPLKSDEDRSTIFQTLASDLKRTKAEVCLGHTMTGLSIIHLPSFPLDLNKIPGALGSVSTVSIFMNFPLCV